ncbi:MAG: hypothetical protein IJD70_01350 [Clostridia bacterium]|nr:hypothetical protein [Clostridia bacterium]
MYKLYMEFENPTAEMFGKRRSVQGMAIHGDTAFVLYHSGVAGAYDLVSRDPKPVGIFKLGSYCKDEEDKRYDNHANDAMFGATMPGEDFPLMYVTAGNSGDADEKGWLAYCAVEQIRLRDDVYSAETVQRIYYKPTEKDGEKFEIPGWGWPASLVDVKNGFFYLHSARYRTKREMYRPDNEYIVTKFRLPDPAEGDVTFTADDILDQFFLPFNAFATQGGTIYDDKLYYSFGFGREDTPDALNVIDLKEKKYALCEDLSTAPFFDQEVECVGFYKGRMLINTQKCKIYEREEFNF